MKDIYEKYEATQKRDETQSSEDEDFDESQIKEEEEEVYD